MDMKQLSTLLPFLVLPAEAQELPAVPATLFGVSLGSIYEYSPDGAGDTAVGTFPVKRLVSERQSVHKGLSLYFEPLTEYTVFPFRETAQADGANRITSYRLHVFPVIPSGDTTLAELREQSAAEGKHDRMVPWRTGIAGW
jgi:hypothetical protein